jgi:signal transduction histidine kinase
MEFDAKAYNLTEIIIEAAANYKANIFEKNINFQLELDENIPVFVDKNMMDLVFRNLITNAIKFTPEEGTIKIYSKSQDNFIEIFVKDSGIGMPDYILRNLFSIDVKISREGTNKEKGTGLGMVLIKECIEKNNGTIIVESSEILGTEFKLQLGLIKN